MKRISFQLACQYFFKIIEPIILLLDPPSRIGRPRLELRKVFYTIIYKLKTGSQWKIIEESRNLVNGTTANRVFNRWAKKGILDIVVFIISNIFDETLHYDITWQSIDGTKCQAPVRGEKLNTEGRGPNPTDRGFSGTKISLQCDKNGAPLGLVIAGANVHDAKLLEDTIRASHKTLYSIMGSKKRCRKMNLCLDRGYYGEPSELISFLNGFHSHIQSRAEESSDKKKLAESLKDGLLSS